MGRISALPAIQRPADNPTLPAKVALGAQLFLDKRLSGSGNHSCQSCHYRELGWTDATVLSRRDNGDLNTRHTPSLYNVGHQSVWYGDGRAATLEDNIVKSLTAYLPTKNSENAPWDRYEMGDVAAVSKAAVEGWQLFSGKGGCTACHTRPSMATAPSSTSAWITSRKSPTRAVST